MSGAPPDVGAGWLTLECERVLYVDRGKTTILCDRLPSPVTLVVKPVESTDRDSLFIRALTELAERSSAAMDGAAARLTAIEAELAASREKFTMHTAAVHAWFSALLQEMGIASEGETVDVATACSKAMDWVGANKAENAALKTEVAEARAAERAECLRQIKVEADLLTQNGYFELANVLKRMYRTLATPQPEAIRSLSTSQGEQGR